MSWTFAEERPIYWEEPPEQVAITNVETGEWDFYMLTSKAMRMIRDAKDDANWLHAELHGLELEAARAERTCHDFLGEVESFECSECHRRTNETKFPNYCPNCGAKVVEE